MMKKLSIALALAGAAVAPVAAQTLPPAVIVVVNIDEVFQESAAGKAAQTELKTRLDGIQARLASLRTSFGAEPALGVWRPSQVQVCSACAGDFGLGHFVLHNRGNFRRLCSRRRRPR